MEKQKFTEAKSLGAITVIEGIWKKLWRAKICQRPLDWALLLSPTNN
jgi:hypothetical protein